MVAASDARRSSVGAATVASRRQVRVPAAMTLCLLWLTPAFLPLRLSLHPLWMTFEPQPLVLQGQQQQQQATAATPCRPQP